MRSKPRFLFPQLPLDADHAGEQRSDREAQQAFPELEVRRNVLGRLVLGSHDPLDPGGAEVDHRVELVPRERLPLRRRLHLDEASVGVMTTFMSVSALESSE